ncbi:hypothetical protein QC820_06600 [Halomonas mongoliensis]|uniref:Lipoprotein n=1 Tax=Halomonas mongoliensis TaxID=321265 RepID=A0ABU1GKE4_9GAMM|nr:hypothetical protein [Halomonas mongoliensis]MDR5892481.1 hypothetical protein [Halomonas mongoliensis]
MLKKAVLVSAIAVALAGCGSKDPVDVVKESTPSGANGLTYAQWAEARTMCDTTRWAVVENPRNPDIPMVEYRCSISGGADHFAEEGERRVAALEERHARQAEANENDLERMRAELVERYEYLAMWEAAVEDPEVHDDVKRVRRHLQETVDEKKALENFDLARLHDPVETWGILEPDLQTDRYLRAHQQLQENPDWPSRQQDFERAKNRLERSIAHRVRQIERQRIPFWERSLERSLEDVAQQAESVLESLQREIAHRESRIAEREELLPVWAQEAEQERAELRAQFNLASVDEVIRWKIVDDFAEPAGAYIARIPAGNGQVINQAYSHFGRLTELVYRTEVDGEAGDADFQDFVSWRQRVGMMRNL